MCRYFNVFLVMLFMNRTDTQVTQQTDNQQTRHDVHGNAISLGSRNAAFNLTLADIVNQHRANNGRS